MTVIFRQEKKYGAISMQFIRNRKGLLNLYICNL